MSAGWGHVSTPSALSVFIYLAGRQWEYMCRDKGETGCVLLIPHRKRGGSEQKRSLLIMIENVNVPNK